MICSFMFPDFLLSNSCIPTSVLHWGGGGGRGRLGGGDWLIIKVVLESGCIHTDLMGL
jgi:hypothetical protein